MSKPTPDAKASTPAAPAVTPAAHAPLARISVARKDIVRLPKNELIAFVKQYPEDAAATIHALTTMNTSMLPDTAFVRREEGFIKKVTVRVTLTERAKQVVRIPGKRYKDESGAWQTGPDSFDISAIGYYTLNQIAGLTPIMPEYVVVAGQRQPNPYIQEDPRSNLPSRVYVRQVVIGRAQATGNLVANDLTLVLDLDIVVRENLLKKLEYAEGNKATFGQWGVADEKPKLPEGCLWRFYAIHADTGIWVNIAHPEFAKVLKEHLQKCKFADRIAQTLAKRNAMKSHPAMPPSVAADESGAITVLMVGWVQNISQDTLNKFRDMVNAGTLDSNEEIEVVTATVKADTEADLEEAARVTEEEVTVTQHDEQTDPENQPAPVDVDTSVAQEPHTPVGESQEPSPARAELLEALKSVYKELRETNGKKAADAAVKKSGMPSDPAKATDDQIRKFIKDNTP